MSDDHGWVEIALEGLMRGVIWLWVVIAILFALVLVLFLTR